MHKPWEFAAIVAVVAVALTAAVRGRLNLAAARAREASVRQQLFDDVQPVNVTNCELARFGAPNDGGYLVCANLLNDVSSAYSYGIAGRDEWGCQISQKLSVAVHEYDCFDVREPSCPDGRLVFHPECVGPRRSTQAGKPFDSVAGHVERNGDSGKRLVIKMDVEGAEWDTFLATPDRVFEQIDDGSRVGEHPGSVGREVAAGAGGRRSQQGALGRPRRELFGCRSSTL